MSIRPGLILAVTLLFIGVHPRAQNSAEFKEAVIVTFSGTSEVFTETKEKSAGETAVVFDGKKYLSKKLHVGLKVRSNDILRTGTDGRIKALSENGDVIVVGPASAVTVPFKRPKSNDSPESKVIYGNIRATVDKNGPLSGIKIKTPSAVAGVRGTDLYVSYNPSNDASQIHVLRGVVQVDRIKDDKIAESTQVKTGEKALSTAPELKITASNKVDLNQIVMNTKTEVPKLDTLQPEEKKNITALLERSETLILRDIKETTPEVYKALQAKKIEDINQVSQFVVDQLTATAPAGPSKPRLSDFESQEDVYEKYFKKAK